MIVVLFPPGCYGTYISRCLYNYTMLSSGTGAGFTFDKHGSSHVYRQDSAGFETVWPSHIEDYTNRQPSDKIVTIIAHPSHYLDYIDNQFTKHWQEDIIQHIISLFGNNDWYDKLHSQWGVNSQREIPRWIVRELMSFYLVDCLNNGYAAQPYKEIKSIIEITTSDLFIDFLPTLISIANSLSIELTTPQELIIENHNKFLASQVYHNIQLKCQQWVDDCINFRSSQSPCKTILDESYIQHLLREQGYEIQCDGLNKFPTNSAELRKIIYK